jgi:pyrimidine deaminase RibD-like protein
MEIMKRALELARGGWWKNKSQPSGWAVIVKMDRIVAEGFS